MGIHKTHNNTLPENILYDFRLPKNAIKFLTTANGMPNGKRSAHVKLLMATMLVSFTCLYLAHVNDMYINQNIIQENSYDFSDDIQLRHSGHIRKIITKTNYPVTVSAPFKIQNPDVCRRVEKVSCLIMVHTAPSHTWQRTEMRRTWLNKIHYSPENIAVIFLLGSTTSKTEQNAIYNESRIYGDIVQGNFIDSYHNLTLKGVMGLRWISENCKNAQLVAKIDDDAFINMFKLFENFSHLKQKKRFIFCNAIGPRSMPIIRQRSSKWFVKADQFKDYKVYPHAYCSGFVVFVSIDLIPWLYRAAISSPFFWIDDVFLFGILPSKVKGVTRQKFGKILTFSHPKALKCYKEKKRKCEYLVMPAKNKEIGIMWKAVVSDRKQSIYGNYYMR